MNIFLDILKGNSMKHFIRSNKEDICSVIEEMKKLAQKLEENKYYSTFFYLEVNKENNSLLKLSKLEDFFEEAEKTDSVGIKISTFLKYGYDDIARVNVIFDFKKQEYEIRLNKGIEYELFKETFEKVKSILEKQNKYKVNVVGKKYNVEESDFDLVNVGFLGDYLIKWIGYESDNEEDDENTEIINTKIKEVMNMYSENKDRINHKILFEMFKALKDTGADIWNEKSFEKIIDMDLLPENFEQMEEDEKKELFYGFDFSEKNIIEMLNEKLPFLNIDKFKEDIKIGNIVIEEYSESIFIEFEGFCDFFTAYVEMKYSNNFEIESFSAT